MASQGKKGQTDQDQPEDKPAVATSATPAAPTTSVADPAPEPPAPVEGAEQDFDSTPFPKSRLVNEANGFFGVSSHLVAGALHGVADDAELTINEARGKLAAFGHEG